MKKIMARTADGRIDVITPRHAVLIRMQRNREGFDFEKEFHAAVANGEDAKSLARELIANIDIDVENKKQTANNWHEKAVTGYAAFALAYNKGICTYDEAVDLIAQKDGWYALEYKIFDADEVKNSENVHRIFRNALDFDGHPKFDMGRAREIHLDNIRKYRNKELENADIETIRAVGAGNNARRDEIEIKKQELRDLPDTIKPLLDNAETIEDLLAIDALVE